MDLALLRSRSCVASGFCHHHIQLQILGSTSTSPSPPPALLTYLLSVSLKAPGGTCYKIKLVQQAASLHLLCALPCLSTDPPYLSDKFPSWSSLSLTAAKHFFSSVPSRSCLFCLCFPLCLAGGACCLSLFVLQKLPRKNKCLSLHPCGPLGRFP